jgi:hypothetical protein
MFAQGRVVICCDGDDGDVFGQTRQARSLAPSQCRQKKRCLPFVCLSWEFAYHGIVTVTCQKSLTRDRQNTSSPQSGETTLYWCLRH